MNNCDKNDRNGGFINEQQILDSELRDWHFENGENAPLTNRIQQTINRMGRETAEPIRIMMLQEMMKMGASTWTAAQQNTVAELLSGCTYREKNTEKTLPSAGLLTLEDICHFYLLSRLKPFFGEEDFNYMRNDGTLVSFSQNFIQDADEEDFTITMNTHSGESVRHLHLSYKEFFSSLFKKIKSLDREISDTLIKNAIEIGYGSFLSKYKETYILFHAFYECKITNIQCFGAFSGASRNLATEEMMRRELDEQSKKLSIIFLEEGTIKHSDNHSALEATLDDCTYRLEFRKDTRTFQLFLFPKNNNTHNDKESILLDLYSLKDNTDQGIEILTLLSSFRSLKTGPRFHKDYPESKRSLIIENIAILNEFSNIIDVHISADKTWR